MPQRKDMPTTLRRSPREAQDIWSKTRDSAERTYGGGQRATRVAYASLKRTFEKVGDHWEHKRRGGRPAGRTAQRRGPATRGRPRAAGGRVDANASKAHLYEMAKRKDIPGRSTMNKAGLVAALRRASRRDTAKARGR